MKRYTGQKALYEAISRSRAKAKRGNILERFLPEANRQEKPAAPEEQPPVEPLPTPSATPQPAANEPPRSSIEKEKEKPREPVVVRENAKLRRLTPVEKAEVPPEKPAVAVTKPWPVERIGRPVSPAGPVQTWWRLKPLQLNAGRIEVSVPYHIGVVIILVVTLVVLTAYRMGQKHPAGKTRPPAQTMTSTPGTKPNTTAETAVSKAAQSGVPAASSPAAPSAPPQGDHWIIVKQSKQKADLDAVQGYFEKNGIDLVVASMAELRKILADRGFNSSVLKGDAYMLVARGLYGNPDTPGTDGYDMKQKIIEVGRKYKAAPGMDTFAPRFFSDAYGMKVSKIGQQEK